jgi:O-antigen ligase
MAIFYLGLWWTAVLAGGLMATRVIPRDGLNVLAVVWLFAAILSVGIALVQWTGALSLGIYGVDLPPGWQPFGNVAQANHLCTLCFLGLCGILWLHQRNKINGISFGLAAGFLLMGMVMTQSRTGWLQIGLLLVWAMGMRAKANLRITRSQLAMLGLVFAAGVVLWPAICEMLLLQGVRSVGDQMRPGARVPYWLSMLDAIGREPLWGYGWQQAGMAQQRVALDHPTVGAQFDHSHNLVLDLLLWNGIPVGLLLLAVLAWWFIAHIRACRDARVAWLLAAVGGLFAHAMVEFPLQYAYFLIPAGLAMGAIEIWSSAESRSLQVSRWAALAIAALLGAMFAVTVVDYVEAEENYRTLRMESARIGVDRVVTPAPELRLLTQLESLLQFARIEATPDMPPEQVDWLRRVSQRFAYPPVLFRYALAAGLNGQPEVARETLALICRIHEPKRCLEAREGWATLQAQYPALAGIAVADKP